MKQGHLKIARHKILITRKVKGVGFRYHVLQLAERYRLSGFVANCSEGVQIEVEGAGDNLDLFLQVIRSNPPLYSHVAGVKVSSISLKGEKKFKVLPDIESCA